MNWALTFGTILDSVWRACNDVVFNNIGTNFTDIFYRAQDLAISSNKTNTLFQNLQPLFRNSVDLPLIGWNPPLQGCIKVNVDASICDAGFQAGCGGVARNHFGEFLYGFSSKLTSCSVEEGELRAVLQGLKLVVDRGDREMVVESDSQLVIDWLSNRFNPQHPLSSIIEEIIDITNVSCNVRWSRIPREFNKVADILAKHSSNLEVYDIAPHFILSSILEDKMGRLFM